MAYYPNNNPESSTPGRVGQHQTTPFANSTNTRSGTLSQQQHNLHDASFTHNSIQTPLHMVPDGSGPAPDGAGSSNSASHYYPAPNTGQRPAPYYNNMPPQFQSRSIYPNTPQFPQNLTGSHRGQDFTRHDSLYASQPTNSYGPPRGRLPNASLQNCEQPAARPYQSTRPGSGSTNAGFASKAVNDAIQQARSVPQFIQSAGGSSQNKQRMSGSARSGQDGSHETNQYEMGSRSAEDTALQSMSSAVHRSPRNVEADAETEVLGSEDIPSNFASRSTISSSLVSQDAESDPPNSAGRKQVMTHSTVAEVFGDGGFKLKWASADAARNHVFRRIKFSKLKDDDVEEVKKDEKKYVLQLMKAIAESSFLGPQNQRRRSGRALDEAEQAEWTRWQKESGDVLDHIMTGFDKPMITDQIEATAWMIFEEIVKAHEFGHRPTKHVNETSICSERLRLAVNCISEFTRVREDIFTGFDYQDFASDPTGYGRSKLSNLWSNLGKALTAAAAQGKPRELKKRIATTNSAIYARLYSAAEIKKIKDEEKAAAARDETQGVDQAQSDDGDQDGEDGAEGSGQSVHLSTKKQSGKRTMTEDDSTESPPSKRAKKDSATKTAVASTTGYGRAVRSNPPRRSGRLRSTNTINYQDDTDGADDAEEPWVLSSEDEQDSAGVFERRDEASGAQTKNSNLMMPNEHTEAVTYASATQRDTSSVGNVQTASRGSLLDEGVSDDITATTAGPFVLGSTSDRRSRSLGQVEDRNNPTASSLAGGNNGTVSGGQTDAVNALLDVAGVATDEEEGDFGFEGDHIANFTNGGDVHLFEDGELDADL